MTNLPVPVLYSMAILRPGVRELGRRECKPNLIHTVCGPSQYFYTDAAKRQAARELGEGKGGGAKARVCIGGCSISICIPSGLFLLLSTICTPWFQITQLQLWTHSSCGGSSCEDQFLHHGQKHVLWL